MISPLPLIGLLSAASAQAPAQFAAEALRICLTTRADPAEVGALARAEGWTVADAETAPGKFSFVIKAKKKNERTFVRNRAWAIEKDGTIFTVSLLDYPDEPRARACALSGWDLDFDAVDAAARTDGRISGDGNPYKNFPVRYYYVPAHKAALHYVRHDQGAKPLHVLSVMLRDD
jgi:hypothetical protein